MDKKQGNRISLILVLLGALLLLLALTSSFTGLKDYSEILFWSAIAIFLIVMSFPYIFYAGKYPDELIEKVRDMRASGETETEINVFLKKSGFNKEQISEIIKISNFYTKGIMPVPGAGIASVSHKGYASQTKTGLIISTIHLLIIAFIFYLALQTGAITIEIYVVMIIALAFILIGIPLCYRKKLRNKKK